MLFVLVKRANSAESEMATDYGGKVKIKFGHRRLKIAVMQNGTKWIFCSIAESRNRPKFRYLGIS